MACGWDVASSGRLVDYMRGGLDELLLFNRALGASEIAATAGSAGLVRSPRFIAMQPLGNSQVRLTI